MEFPFFNQEGVKELVIKILSSTWPISVKDIYLTIREKYGVKVSYQAVHKSVTELLAKKVIEKENGEYRLSQDWVKSIVDHASKLEIGYLKMVPVMKKGVPEKITFHELFSMYLFFLEVLYEHTFDRGNEKPVFFRGFYTWNPISLSEKETIKLKEMTNTNRLYVITQSNTPFDKICKGLWEDHGIKVINGIPGAVTDCDVVVIGDYVFNIYYPPDLRDNFSSIYEKIKQVGDINLMEMHRNILYKKTEIKVLISQDKEIANQTRQSISKYFKNGT